MTFFSNLSTFADNTACIDQQGQARTYRELVAACDVLAAAFPPGRQLCFIRCENSFESLVGYLACLRAGHPVLLVDGTLDAQLLANLKQVYQPDVLWQPIGEDAGAVHTLGHYGLFATGVKRETGLHDALALLLSTSGSTGSPKLVRLTAASVDANAASIAQYLHLAAAERAITSLPMHYSYGLSVINSHLSVGGTILLTNDSIVTKTFWDFFRSERATSFAGVPYLYEILRRLRFERMDLPTLKTMTQAGGKLRAEFVQEYATISRTKGFDFYVMYGQTEATARISYLPPEKNLEKSASIGIAIPGGKLSLLDESGVAIAQPNVEGELVYEGPNVMMGYAQSVADLSLGDELRGRLVTGDIARFDEEGYVYITGRKKRFLKIHGNRVNLEEVENHLKSENFTCVCGGSDDALCIATVQAGRGAEIVKAVTAKFGYHHSVVKVIEVEKIPVSSSGKILYEQLFSGGAR